MVRAIYLNYGKPCSIKEIKSVKLTCLAKQVSLEIVSMEGLGAVQRNFAALGPVDPDELDIGYLNSINIDSVSGRSDGLYISGFHSILSAAAYYAQITDSSVLALGVIKEQFAAVGKLDVLLERFSDVVSILNSAADRLNIIAPYKTLDKSAVAREAIRLGVPIAHTWSCVLGESLHCGACPQCKARKASLAGLTDPTIYSA